MPRMVSNALNLSPLGPHLSCQPDSACDVRFRQYSEHRGVIALAVNLKAAPVAAGCVAVPFGQGRPKRGGSSAQPTHIANDGRPALM
jgi:hypothetical protein